ncbi:tetratricopeptide repeat protein [Candidatus Albibeggiatoa sp. nov. NOAA]|uniref:tetratricopeptide repeat protein n=1 Tax=Candidatus Albibeggiatoa sp. nov. NOAA TaxID=3162724 RepID=UPI003301B849|nr:tetratricopeptide repeat protein [Thiotrichaceae bacterium]
MSAEQPIYSPSIFIGRKDEIATFETMLNGNSDCWILRIEGEGGIGKTKLLQEYIKIARDKPSILVTDIIDFYLTENKTEIGILKNIAKQLNEQKFYEFFDSLKKNTDSTDISAIARDDFLNCLPFLKDEQKIILVFDTIELANDAVIRFFSDFLDKLKEALPNLMLVVSGRPLGNKDFLKPLPFTMKEPPPLQGLSKTETQNYFLDEKIIGYLANQNIQLTSKQIDKFIDLTQGKPILIALVVDWLKIDNSISKLLSINKGEQAFEQALIKRIANLTYPEDQVIWAMAHIYRRFDEKILAYIFPSIEISARELIESLASFSFIKIRYSEQGEIISCLLHDEMRRLITDYVLANEDKFHNVRKDWSQRLIKYYDNLITKTNDELEKRHLYYEQLFYQLDANIQKGIEQWRKLIYMAQSWEHKESLHAEIDYYRKILDANTQAELDSHIAYALYEQNKYLKAINLLKHTLESGNCTTEIEAKIHSDIILFYSFTDANQALVKGGEHRQWFQGKIKSFSKSKNFSLIRRYGNLLNNIGYAYRKEGNIEKAIEYYKLALKQFSYATNDFAKDIDDFYIRRAKHSEAATKNNLGYLLHLQGRDKEASPYCKTALRIRKRLGDYSEIGLSYNVLGIIESDKMHREPAIKYFEQALGMFEKAKDLRGRGLVYLAYGRMLRQLGWDKVRPSRKDFDIAADDYSKSQSMLVEAKKYLSRADIFYYVEASYEIGTLLSQKGEFIAAIQELGDCVTKAIEVEHHHIHARCLQELATVYFAIKDYPKSKQFTEKAIQEATVNEIFYVLSRAQRILADLQFYWEDYDEAFNTAYQSSENLLKTDMNSQVDNPIKQEYFYDYWQTWFESLIRNLPTKDKKKEYANKLIENWEMDNSNDQYTGFIIAVEEASELE